MNKYNASAKLGSSRLLWMLFLAVLALGLIVYSYLKTGQDREHKPPPPLMQPAEYQSEIQPILVEYRKTNADSIQRLRQRINANFKQYRSGVPAFTEDIVSWKARYYIVTKGTAEFFSEDQEKVERYVEGVFEGNIVSAKGLERDLRKVLIQFQQDMSASRNTMLSEVESALSDYPDSSFGDRWLDANDSFIEYVDQQVFEISKDAAMDGTQAGLRNLVVGVAVEEVVRISTIMILQKIATGIATTAATSGGATATTTAAGGATGTVITPGVGTAIGIGAGLIVGGVVDWWMSDRLQGKLSDQCLSFLQDMQSALINDENGVLKSLGREVIAVGDLYDETMQKALIKGGGR